MTKDERLQELKDQDKVEKIIMNFFDRDYRAFVRNIRKQNKLSNERMYRIIASIKGKDFADDVKDFMKSIKEQYAVLHTVKKPVGIEFKDSRYKTIPKICVEQRSGSIYSDDSVEGYKGSLCIQLKEDRWIKIDYQN